MAFGNNEIKGNVVYNKDIILQIIKVATMEIKGVGSLASPISSGLKKLFSSNTSEGVNVSYADGVLAINVYINVFYGYNVSEIAYKVQENIKRAVLGTVEIELGKINVHVLGVDFKPENNIDVANVTEG